MNFTDEEKEIFKIRDDGTCDIAMYINKYLVNIYNINNNEEMKHSLNITLNFIKRMIVEIAEKRGYNIIGNETYDVDKLLNEIISNESYQKEGLLPNFNPMLYKDSDELNKYFYSLTKDLSWEEVSSLINSFEWINDGFRTFFADNFGQISKVGVNAYLELLHDGKDDNWDLDDEFVTDLNNNSETVDDSDFDDWDSDNWESDDDFSIENTGDSDKLEDVMSEESLINVIKFINVVNELVKYRDLGITNINKLIELMRQKKLDDFYSNPEFSMMFDMIMDHDINKCSYYFHGTQCLEDAQSIIDEGLGMMREDLTTTSYREFTKDEVLLYERGFGGEIGHDAIVIIEVPKDDFGRELNVVEELQNKSSIHFNPSGLQGLNGGPNYIVSPEYIVGYIDKKNKKIVLNSKYKNYEQFSNNIQL